MAADPILTTTNGHVNEKNKVEEKHTSNIRVPPLSSIPKPGAHVMLTTHPRHMFAHPVNIQWGAIDPMIRGPIVGTLSHPGVKNVVGTHSGSYAVYRAMAVASGDLDPFYIPDLTNTSPPVTIGPYPSWYDPDKIVSLDPWGHDPCRFFKPYFDEGYDIRPTIAITRAHIQIPELMDSIRAGRIQIDHTLVTPSGSLVVTKAAVDPVWYLPGIARRFNTTEELLRRTLFEQTGGMYPELITRSDLHTFLPPIGNITLYIFGNPDFISDPSKILALRIHDECNGSDVFGSDICTCRPYLAHGIEVCVQTAQQGGVGLIAYFRKEGRCLGEVTKFLVYNARKRQPGGDRGETYFQRTECVAGVQDMRFQALMPDVLHWLGISRIDRLVSMSDMKYNAIVQSGIQVVERIPIPEYMIPEDARVEIDAKVAHGYFNQGNNVTEDELRIAKGRHL